jgi:hypothetical protein
MVARNALIVIFALGPIFADAAACTMAEVFGIRSAAAAADAALIELNATNAPCVQCIAECVANSTDDRPCDMMTYGRRLAVAAIPGGLLRCSASVAICFVPVSFCCYTPAPIIPGLFSTAPVAVCRCAPTVACDGDTLVQVCCRGPPCTDVAKVENGVGDTESPNPVQIRARPILWHRCCGGESQFPF